ncbi:KOW domain-containing RNA-binding protein [Alicyclobacillus dauci]|uniref:KOW domain-containing RNA-binding protein n=1 Tax=Alicyclobacillus dauci TaxID=1475485 RepID=A0ABY6Z3J3_9BACL|nr:KOW domain-containing RNA-binding protein [Alicyclobacillus dauci]WAH37412.1 KOW domain-containing RNA-binding protein [Alicyclobacillus dauci]
MSVPRDLPPVGSVVEVIQGRDAGLVAVVVGHADERFLFIADGSMRRSDKPKKKNISHVRKMAYVAQDVAEKIKLDGRVNNAQLRYAIRKFVEERLVVAQESAEGGAVSG